jgi:hypothetical protein
MSLNLHFSNFIDQTMHWKSKVKIASKNGCLFGMAQLLSGTGLRLVQSFSPSPDSISAAQYYSPDTSARQWAAVLSLLCLAVNRAVLVGETVDMAKVR